MPVRQPIDTAEWTVLQKRMQERRWLLAASLIVGLGLVLTYRAKTRSFDMVRGLMAEQAVVDLSTVESSRALQPVFALIYPDANDQKLAAEHTYTEVVRRRAGSLLGGAFQNVGALYTSALAVPAFRAEQGGPAFRARLAQARARLGMDPEGRPLPADTMAAPLAPDGSLRIAGCVTTRNGMAMPGVAVTLRGTRAADTTTDADGCYAFTGLTAGDAITIRPVRRYYAFPAQTVVNLSDSQQRDFQARDHRLLLLDDAEQLQRLKAKLIVRSPVAYTWTFWGLVLVYLAAIYSLHVFWFRQRFAGDPVLLPVLHVLTGLSLLLMFSLPDPLRDTLRAEGFVVGVAAGCLMLGIASRLDFQRGFWRKYPFVWLGVGVCVAVVLYQFGSGPTGSDARVNLNLPFIGSVQPVELIKLCLVLFLAGYLARTWLFLRELQQHRGLPRFLQRFEVPRLRDLVPIAVSIGVALGTFYLLRDMGPALVVGCTFLLLYGVVRDRWIAVGAGLLVLVGCFWIIYHSQAVPMVASRIRMLLSPWENFVTGGEHLAQAYWALATGGATGQGLGSGHPNYIPAAHTDMVLPALGEELGLLGLLAIFALYGVLIYRGFRIALHAGGIYSLFLGLSITLLTLFQVVLIAGGSFGLIPLSGVVTPFLSYGKSSMMMHCLLLGMLASLSARPGTPVQETAQQQQFRRPVRYLGVASCIVLGIVMLKAVYVQTVVANDWSIKPALIVRGSGERAYTYNPRLLDARRAITRGTVYDRNGIPLATSRWDEVEHFHSVYEDLSADLDRLDPAGTRQYPFGALTFYLLGDIQTRVKWGAGNSLYAEHAFLSHLRGYDNYPQPVEKKRREAGEVEPILRYNYVELLPLVRFGPTNAQARQILRRDRNLRLTIDVQLQRNVADILQAQVAEGKVASVVVLDVATGDVLASVTHPLPEQAYTDPSAAHLDEQLFDRGYGQGAKPPGSVAKLVTAIAAFNTTPRAATWRYPVRASDRYARRGEPTGTVDMGRAIAASSNVYFAALAREVVGADTLLQAFDTFGFGIGMPGGTERQKLDLLNAPDNLRQAGFGQGPVTASPLSVALVAATIANRGVRPEVRWVIDSTKPHSQGAYVLMPHHAQVLAGFMRRVIMDAEGTAKSLRRINLPIAGKTGTAEEVQIVERDGKRVTTRVNHAWFTGFAPYEVPGTEQGIPKIAVAVLVEEGGSGGRIAAPIAGAIIEAAADLGLIAAPATTETANPVHVASR